MGSNITPIEEAFNKFDEKQVKLYRYREGLNITEQVHNAMINAHIDLIKALIKFLLMTKYDNEININKMNEYFIEYSNENEHKDLSLSEQLCRFLTKEFFWYGKSDKDNGKFCCATWMLSFEFYGARIEHIKHHKIALALTAISFVGVIVSGVFFASNPALLPLVFCVAAGALISLCYFMHHQMWLEYDEKFTLPLENNIRKCHKDRTGLFFNNPDKAIAEAEATTIWNELLFND